MFILLMALLSLDGSIAFNEVTGLGPIPDESELFLEEPRSFDFDSAGHFYVLDGGAKVIFKWDKQGRFVGTIGKAGQGPGELVLAGRGPAGGIVNVLGDRLYLMDPAKREIMIFGLDGTFERAIPLRFARGRVLGFYVKNEKEFLFHWRRRGDDNVLNELVMISDKGETIRVIDSRPDNSFQRRGTSRSNRSFTIRAFNPSLVSFYDRARGELLMGFSGEPNFQVVDEAGKKRSVKVPLMREEVTAADKEEFGSSFTSPRFQPTIEYPDKKSYYTHLISLGDDGFLVYSQSEPNRRLKGIHMDREGKVSGRFEMACGQEGGLLASKGRVLRVSLNEDEDFELRELKIK